MAAAPDPGEVLRSTDGKANFQRLARLLISGGTSLLREIFDAVHPPSNLPTVLSNPATKKQLNAAKLTKPQWDCLYPSAGVYGKSTDFDVTLLFRLLRTITSLTPPATGWDALPASTDHSSTADLARIKYYRNSVYGHVNQKMEIPDDQFLTLWQEISEALVRIAAQISREKKTAWQEAIDDYRKDPLTAVDERNVKELERWYKNDMDVKKSMEELKTTTQEGINDLKSLKTSQNDFQEETLRMMERGAQCLETAVREEHQVTRNELEEIHHELKLMNKFISSVARPWSTEAVQLQNDNEDTKGPASQVRATGTSIIPQEPQTVVQGATVAQISSNQPQALITTAVQLQNDNEDNEGPASQGRAAGTSIIPQEPQAVVQGATVAQISSNQPQALITTVTDPPSMENDDHPSDLPENQESLRQIILKQFVQLHRQCSELHFAGHEWIESRHNTIEMLFQVRKPHYIHEMMIMLGVSVVGVAAVGVVAGAALSVAAAAAAAMSAAGSLAAGSLAAGTAATAALAPIAKTRFNDAMQQVVQKHVLEIIAEDRIACIKFQQQLDSLGNFISTMAKFLKPLHNDPVLLRKLETRFGARFCRAVTYAATTSSLADATTGAVTRSAALMRELVAPITGYEKALQSYMSTGNSSEFLCKMRMRKPDWHEIDGLIDCFIIEKFTGGQMIMGDK